MHDSTAALLKATLLMILGPVATVLLVQFFYKESAYRTLIMAVSTIVLAHVAIGNFIYQAYKCV
jgi:hypothetical protein